MSGTVNPGTELILVDSRSQRGTVTLPLASANTNRRLTIKDAYGSANVSSITIQTGGSDTFENGATSMKLANPYDSVTLYVGLSGKWSVAGGSVGFGFAASTMSTTTLNAVTISTTNLQTAALSSLAFQTSSINSVNITDYVSTQNLVSTTLGISSLILSTLGSGLVTLNSTMSTVALYGSSFLTSTATAQALYTSSITTKQIVRDSTALNPWIESDPLRTSSFSTMALSLSSINALSPSQFIGSNVPASLSTTNIYTNTETTSSILTSSMQTPQFITTANEFTVKYPASADASKALFHVASTGYIAFGTSTPSNIVEITDWTSPSYTNAVLALKVTKNINAFQVADLTGTVKALIDNTGAMALNKTSLTAGRALDVAGSTVTTALNTNNATVSSLNVGVIDGNVQVGSVSSINQISFYGLQGNYNQSVLAEVSTGTGTQDLLIFKGSTTTDRIKFQTTGGVRFETGVTQRIFSTTQNGDVATPTMVMDTNNCVGINMAAPTVTLDVAGTGRFQFLSTAGIDVPTLAIPNLCTNTINVSTIYPQLLSNSSIGFFSTMGGQTNTTISSLNFSTQLTIVDLQPSTFSTQLTRVQAKGIYQLGNSTLYSYTGDY